MRDDGSAPTLPMASGEGHDASGALGRFVVEGTLGRGGMGIVLSATDPELGRRVAIKVLHPELAAAARSPRLQREAQAMAKLTHPNVVTVYEVGRQGDLVFVVMELVEGTTLRAWLRERQRDWRDIVRMFVAAGRGLEAAHRAGLVHRDFKPDNVLVGGDGRPRVADFGLAAGAVPEAHPTPDGADVYASLSFAGTPAYMSPEQWAGGPVDARTDQFAFCASLWAALHGSLPFAGSTPSELGESVIAGRRRPPARPVRLTPGLVPAIDRGLAADPAARWPDMTALLDRLQALVARRRTAGIAVGAIAAVALGAGATWALRSDPARCPDPRPRLAGIWDRALADGVARRLATAGPAYAAVAWAKATAELDRYADEWVRARTAACRATHVDHAQSSALLDLRTRCLDERRAALGTLTAAATTGPPDVLARITTEIDALPRIADCDDVERLTAYPLPSAAAPRAAIDAVDGVLTAARAADLRGDVPAMRVLIAQAVAQARATRHPPTLLRALEAEIELTLDAYAEPTSTIREAIEVAAEAKDDAAAAQLWSELVVTSAKVDLEAAGAFLPAARAALVRADDAVELRYYFLRATAVLAAGKGHYDETMAAFQEAAALPGLPEGMRATALGWFAEAAIQTGRGALAIGPAREAYEMVRARVGDGHPAVADALATLAKAEIQSGSYDDAETDTTRALEINRRAFGDRSERLAQSYMTLANLADLRQDDRRARELLTQAMDCTPADDLPRRALYTGMRATYGGRGGDDAAAALDFEGARALFAQAGQADSAEAVAITFNYAAFLAERDRCRETLPLLDALEPTLDRIPAYRVQVYTLRGNCRIDLGEPAAARDAYESAYAACKKFSCTRVFESAWPLAQLLPASQRQRAIALAEEARTATAKLAPGIPQLAQMDRWLAAHKR